MTHEAQPTNANVFEPLRRFSRNSKVVLVFLVAGLITCLAQGATFKLSLDRTNGWMFLNYRGIPSNTFRVSPAGLVIGVTNSAAPAVFPLTNQLPVTELRVSGKITGLLTIPPGKQGLKGFDDYAIRVGLVESGARTLSWREKLASADWVKKLFALAPPDTGINRIHFLNLGTDAKQVGQTRVHPMSELMFETVVAMPDAGGHFAFTNRFARPMSVLALWIACDGDDTKSTFAVTLNKVELETQSSPAAK